MIVLNYINKSIPELQKTDSIQKAIDWMEEFKLSQLAVVENGDYKGIVTEDILMNIPNWDLNLENVILEHQSNYISGHKHIYEALNFLVENGTAIVPVVDRNEKYAGQITATDLVNVFSELASATSRGGVMVLEMKERDYSLSEISRIIESNGGRILSSYVSNNVQDHTIVQVTIKLNKEDISSIVASMERYQYKVIAGFQESESQDDQYDRLNMLFKYLDM